MAGNDHSRSLATVWLRTADSACGWLSSLANRSCCTSVRPSADSFSSTFTPTPVEAKAVQLLGGKLSLFAHRNVPSWEVRRHAPASSATS